VNALLIITVLSKYLNFATQSKYLLAVLIFRFCPAFWWLDMDIYAI